MNSSNLNPIWLDIPNYCSPADGICSGGRPQFEHLQQAKAKGITTVISLCPPTEAGSSEEARQVAQLGMRFVNIPVAGPADLTRVNAQQLAAALENCGPKHPALIHCASGNRVGALLALKAFWLDGLPALQALEFGKRSGLTQLEPAVRQLLGL